MRRVERREHFEIEKSSDFSARAIQVATWQQEQMTPSNPNPVKRGSSRGISQITISSQK